MCVIVLDRPRWCILTIGRVQGAELWCGDTALLAVSGYGAVEAAMGARGGFEG